MNYEAFLLRTHRICSDVHLCETQEWLCWKLPRLGLSVHMSALVCVHPPSAHKWPNIVFDTSLTLPAFINLIELETHKVWKSTSSVAAIVLFMNLDQTRTISALVTSGFGVGTPIVFKDRLLIYATVNHQTISLSYVAMIGFAAERRETYFSAKQKWGGRERWGDGRRHFNDEILAVSILEYFAHYLPNTFLMKYWQAAFIFSLWYRDLFRKGGELKKLLYNLDIMVCGVCIRDGHADAANAEWCG